MNTSINQNDVINYLSKAKEMISDPKVWSKGIKAFRVNGNCMITALYEIYKDDNNNTPVYKTAIEYLSECIAGGNEDNPFKIIDFNDDENTTHDMVMKMFDDAIVKAKEKLNEQRVET